MGTQFNQNSSSEIETDELKKWENSVDILLAEITF